MYWLRWHYHVKDIAGAPYKIKKKERKKRKEKQNNRIADNEGQKYRWLKRTDKIKTYTL